MRLRTVITTGFLFLSAGAFANPSLDCYRYARGRTSLGTAKDEASIVRLCRNALNDDPATCFEEAMLNAGAEKETALQLCEPYPVCTLPDDRLFQIRAR